MKQPKFIFSDSKISRKDNTIVVENKEGKKKYLPVEDLEEIYCFGQNSFNTELLALLSKHKIIMHIFKAWKQDEHWNEYYIGTYYPKEFLNSGFLTVKQVENYANKKKRLRIAKLFIHGAASNIRRNLKNYERKISGLDSYTEKIDSLKSQIDFQDSVQALMGIEGNIRQIYYEAWNEIFGKKNQFLQRVKQPPDNPVNAVISFGNMLCYTQCLSQIYQTQLNPLISFLHEPGERRFSLSLDLAEIFKPILVDRLIFKLFNNGEIQERHFDRYTNACYLNETGMKTFLKAWKERLDSTIQHRKLSRKVSYKRLIRLECYKLIKDLTGVEEYKPLVMDW